MGVFKKLFGADPAALERKADALLKAGELGAAKLTYEKARDASPRSDRDALDDKIVECTDGIARARIGQARAYLSQGALDLAAQELEGAVEVAVSPAIREEAQDLLDHLEADDAREQAVEHELTNEERLALIAGQWQDAQADEYEDYGEPFFDALIAMQNEEHAQARTALEALLQEADAPRYLWLEVGRARLLSDDLQGGKEALEQFVAALGRDEGGETRLAAELALARIADDSGDFDGAMQHFERGVEAMPHDYRAYLAMGAFLRSKEHESEAVEVLETALEMSRSATPDWRLLEELGLAYEAVGKSELAQKFLEQVVEFFTQRQETDLPPSSARTLAALYERAGRLERAADMYRALSQGSDRDRHGHYHFEAGRLLRELGLTDEARRMLTRAQALAGQDAELEGRIAALLQGL